MELKDLIIEKAIQKVASRMEKEAGLAAIGNFAKKYAPELLAGAATVGVGGLVANEVFNKNSYTNKRKRILDYLDRKAQSNYGAILVDKNLHNKFDNLYKIDPGIVNRGLKITGNNKQADHIKQQFAIWQQQKKNPMYLK